MRYEVYNYGYPAQSDEYLKTDCFIAIRDGNRIVTQIERCGITAPGWLCKATYRYGDQIYVYDAGWLIPTREWYAEQAGPLRQE